MGKYVEYYINCPNCTAPRQVDQTICPYCGTILIKSGYVKGVGHNPRKFEFRKFQKKGKPIDIFKILSPVLVLSFFAVLVMILGVILRVDQMQRKAESTRIEERYYGDGGLRSRMEYYEDGYHLARYTEYYPDGELKYESNYKPNRVFENEFQYYSDGTLRYEKFYNNGLLEIVKRYDPDGVLTLQESYEEGTRITSEEYNNGIIFQRKEFWSNGYLKIQEDYDEAGNLISMVYTQEDGSSIN